LPNNPYKTFEQIRKRLQKIGAEEEEGRERGASGSQGRAG